MKHKKAIALLVWGSLLIIPLIAASQYWTMNNGYIKRQSDLAVIPPTEDNADYRQYLDDVKEGANVTPYDYEAEATRQAEAALIKKYIVYRISKSGNSKVKTPSLPVALTAGEIAAEEAVGNIVEALKQQWRKSGGENND